MSRKQSKDSPTVLLNMRLVKKARTNISCIGDVIVNEQNLTETSVKHKGKCHNIGEWKRSVNLLFTESLKKLEHHMQHHFWTSANPVLIYHRTTAIFSHPYSVSTCVLFSVL